MVTLINKLSELLNRTAKYTCMHGFSGSRAFGLALVVKLVPVARAFVLVPISPRRNTLALLAADSAVLEAPILNLCHRASI